MPAPVHDTEVEAAITKAMEPLRKRDEEGVLGDLYLWSHDPEILARFPLAVRLVLARTH